MLNFVLLLASARAAVCDHPLFSIIAAPPPTDDRHGVATGSGTLDGKDMLGGRFSLDSAAPFETWRTVLLQADNQDEWVPKRFGYEISDWIDREHMYLRFDIGFLANAVHVKRQLVVAVANGVVGDRFRTCWRMIDPTPFLPRIADKVSPDVAWERAATGWWELTPKPGGGVVVNYQWWAETSMVPSSLVKLGIRTTLPDLLDAFEERVIALAP